MVKRGGVGLNTCWEKVQDLFNDPHRIIIPELNYTEKGRECGREYSINKFTCDQ